MIHFIFIATRSFYYEKRHEIILLYDKLVDEKIKTLKTNIV